MKSSSDGMEEVQQGTVDDEVPSQPRCPPSLVPQAQAPPPPLVPPPRWFSRRHHSESAFSSRSLQPPLFRRDRTGRGFVMDEHLFRDTPVSMIKKEASVTFSLDQDDEENGTTKRGTVPETVLKSEPTITSLDYLLSRDASTTFLLARDASTAYHGGDGGPQECLHNYQGTATLPDGAFVERHRKSIDSMVKPKHELPQLQLTKEVKGWGAAWRSLLVPLMVKCYDPINALMLSRILQLFVPLLTGVEALICMRFIEALDNQEDLMRVKQQLCIALQNRNVSRLIVSNLSARFDWLWHLNTWITYNRRFDAWGQLPMVGITAFPASENFPATRNHALSSIFRVLLGEGNWITRFLTGGREGLVTDNPEAAAQNLAAETNDFELANNSQYGTTHGRLKTNAFRFHHRLPTDESLLRTFVTSPASTTVNNGVIHVLLTVSRHWHNMLSQPWGNFAHQRMEQLDPFETLRFHMPQMLLLVSNLRGRNRWDSEVLGPFVKKLQLLQPASRHQDDPIQMGRTIATELRDMLPMVCCGVKVWLDPFDSWLGAIIASFDRLEKEARKVFELLLPVEMGIRVGYDTMTSADWRVPSDKVLQKAILHHVHEVKKAENLRASGVDTNYCPRAYGADEQPQVSPQVITKALNRTTPRDKRTFIELVASGLTHSKPAQLLLRRVKTLTQREIRREALNHILSERSVGEVVDCTLHGNRVLTPGDLYYIDAEVHSCLSRRDDSNEVRFLHVESGQTKVIDVSISVYENRIRRYNLVAECINRAQKAYMMIELQYGRTFKYNAFMEFPTLRVELGRLMVVAQMCCERLDDARINVLKEIRRSRSQTYVDPDNMEFGKTYYAFDKKTDAYRKFTYTENTKIHPRWHAKAGRIVANVPQSVAVIGGGPTGLLTVLHCTENCIAADGIMKLYEARDAFLKGGSTFERAQVVRLDARWIAMMRYHLGTSFEDVFISLAGETDAQLGNTLPTQGFVEITIKNLESLLHDECTRLWSAGIISIYTESKAQYDPATKCVLKTGANLKKDDLIKYPGMIGADTAKQSNGQSDIDESTSATNTTWKVIKVTYFPTIALQSLSVGEEYGIFTPSLKQVRPYRLTSIDLDAGEYRFKALNSADSSVNKAFVVKRVSPPSIYPAGTPTSAHGSITHVKIQSTSTGEIQTLRMNTIAKKKFALDVGHTHVVEAIGKPRQSENHFCITTKEPYGVACLQGLKVSLGMHHFGETRFGSGLLDDIRSINDQNTRVIGDFTKMVRAQTVAQALYHALQDDPNWKLVFERVVLDSEFPVLHELRAVYSEILRSCRILAEDAPQWRRKTIQLRFFETGDNYYIGMEFCREYHVWKNRLGDELVAPLRARDLHHSDRKGIEGLRNQLLQYVDRLWYEGVLETVRTGDVYNPGARKHVPRLYLVDSLIPQKLESLPTLEAFRNDEDPNDTEMYEVLCRRGHGRSTIVCRSSQGWIKMFNGSLRVRRESNLSRGPDGNSESKVSLASFEVGHYVNHRSIVNSKNEHVFAFAGDEQATPHFMRYSGLTGAAINAMSFNVFLGKATAGIDILTRCAEYSAETNWSNGEVVQRGTGANYGEDGFLRPGFDYREGVNYLYDRLLECKEMGQDTEDMLSHDWKVKIAAALIPRGLESNHIFLSTLRQEWHTAVHHRFWQRVQLDESVDRSTLERIQILRHRMITGDNNSDAFWLMIEQDIVPLHGFCARRVDRILDQCIVFAQQKQRKDYRVSSSLFHQTKPVDSIIDDFAVEAQSVANALTQSATFAAGALALRLVGSAPASAISALLSALNILISFGTMANISRYKSRNEEARISFYYTKLPAVERKLFSVTRRQYQQQTDATKNPFLQEFRRLAASLNDQLRYYGIDGEDKAYLVQTIAKLETAKFSSRAVKEFQNVLLTDCIPKRFHINSYVQESLVDLYKTTEEMILERSMYTEIQLQQRQQAEALYERLQQFKPRLQSSLQEGHIRWGFLKKRKLAHWDIMSFLAYIRSLFYYRNVARRVGNAPVEIETRFLASELRSLSAQLDTGNHLLHREYLDFETCFWAHRESYVASTVFVMAFFVFCSSILFTFGRVAGLDGLEDAAFWASVPSTFGAILASFHFLRKQRILLGLLGKLKNRSNDQVSQNDYAVVLQATRHQVLLTLVRLCTAVTAAFVLPFALAVMLTEREDNDDEDVDGDINDEDADSSILLPSWLASISVLLGIFSLLYFFYVEYVVRYNLPIDLGPFVCNIFATEIVATYDALAVPSNGMDSPVKEERIRWEYTARDFLHHYRFDTVFAADRFGQILQTIQGGQVAGARGVWLKGTAEENGGDDGDGKSYFYSV